MKKLIILAVFLMSIGLAVAELEIDIPFETDIIGEDFSVVGPFEYESEWMTITNVGSATQTYSMTWTFASLPTNWTVSICNPQFCLSPNWPIPLELAPNEFEELHIAIHTTSTGGFPFSLTFAEGDLVEPIVINFTFNTADNVSADNELLAVPKLGQNFPNPFNPSTTIALNLSQQEASSASLNIYNSKGQIVKTFNQVAQNVVWNGQDNQGKEVNSGIYFYQLKTGDQSFTKKMILLK
jgi:type IX secretion system substrate protein